MTKSAREVIADAIGYKIDPNGMSDNQQAFIIVSALSQAGYVILPKEPSEGMIEAGRTAFYDTDPELETSDVVCGAIYRAMISHAEGEKG